MTSERRLVTLLTDFGLRDHFVAAMKGVMLGVNPELTFIDITHSIPPHDIQSGAFALCQAYSCFPPGTIHLAVVDPGVGTARKALVAAVGGHFFVAPDNGLLSYVFAGEESRQVYEITEAHYFRKPVSKTFHGRDIFSPVAAWISRDVPLDRFGPPITQLVELEIPELRRVRDTLIEATVLAVDHFGNLVTNLKPADIPAYGDGAGRPCRLLVAQREINRFRTTFGEGSPGEIFVVPGSTGFLEIVVRGGSAAAELNVGPGAKVGVILG